MWTVWCSRVQDLNNTLLWTNQEIKRSATEHYQHVFYALYWEAEGRQQGLFYMGTGPTHCRALSFKSPVCRNSRRGFSIISKEEIWLSSSMYLISNMESWYLMFALFIQLVSVLRDKHVPITGLQPCRWGNVGALEKDVAVNLHFNLNPVWLQVGSKRTNVSTRVDLIMCFDSGDVECPLQYKIPRRRTWYPDATHSARYCTSLFWSQSHDRQQMRQKLSGSNSDMLPSLLFNHTLSLEVHCVIQMIYFPPSSIRDWEQVGICNCMSCVCHIKSPVPESTSPSPSPWMFPLFGYRRSHSCSLLNPQDPYNIQHTREAAAFLSMNKHDSQSETRTHGRRFRITN